jgi:RNA polymerase sigma factor (sigma-70 family)
MPAPALRLMGDDRLSRLAAAGDSRAFETIYERHHQALYRYCYSILGSREDAADALQSTMASALRALVGERREIAIKPWLFRIAHNESVSMLRKRRPTAAIESVLELEAPGHDPGLRERLRELVSDMQQLPEAQRGALVMRELSGLAYREVASALETTEPHARQLVYEARTALHDLAEGRSMECETVRHSISDADGRVLRGRRIRSHLRSCEGCRTFDQLTRQRRRDLAAFAPPLPAALAAAVLHKAIGGSSGGAAAAASSGGGTGLGSVVAGKTVLTSAVAKVAAVAVATAAVGTGAAEVVHQSTRHSEREPVHAITKPSTAKPSTAKPAAVPPPTVPAARPPQRSKANREHPDSAGNPGPSTAHKRHPGNANNGAASHGPAAADTPAPVHGKPVTSKPKEDQTKAKNDPPKQKTSNGHQTKPQPAKAQPPAKAEPKPEKTAPGKAKQSPATTAPPQSQNGQPNTDASKRDAQPGQAHEQQTASGQQNGNPHA